MSGHTGSATDVDGAAIAVAGRDPLVIPAETWRRIGRTLMWVAVAALVAVTLGELDRLISSVPGRDGLSHSLNVVLSPLALTHVDSWWQWSGGELHGEIGGWISLSAGIDLLLVLALAQLLLRLVRLSPTRRVVPGAALLVYVCAEIVEDVLQAVGGLLVANGAGDAAFALGWVVAAFSTIKALALIVLGVAVLRIDGYRTRLWAAIRRIGQAVWVHRLATLAVLVIGLLACIPASDLLDQLPDVQRQWADGGGWLHALWAIGAAILTAAVAFTLGRRRTRLLVETRAMGLLRLPARSRWDAAGPWFIAPVALVAVAALALILSAALGLPFPIHLPTFLILLGIMLTIPLVAAAGRRTGAPPETPLPLDAERARSAWLVGDTIAVLGVVAGGIGIVRSYVAPVMLLGQAPAGWTDARTATWSIAMLVVGAASAVLPPLLGVPWLGTRRWRRSGLDPNERAEHPSPDPKRDPRDVHVSPAGGVEAGALVAGSIALVLGMLFPEQIAATVGGVGVTLLALSAWVAVFGAFTLIVQPRELVAPFSWLRLKAAPVLTLGILVPFALNIVLSGYAPDRALHAVQVSNGPAASQRTDTALADYVAGLQTDGCIVESPGHDPVRPVYLIAAEGGGIRAAYWTASALAALDGCGAESGFVASGISGGSIGLAVASTADDLARASGDPDSAAGAIIEAAKLTAGPDVVSTAVLGLTVGDLFAGGTGIRVPSASPDEGGDDPGWRWRDRAALIEGLWERDAPGLAERFSSEIDPRTGMLMLSSTDVVSKCRLLVDQAPVFDREPGGLCDSVGGLPSMLGFRELSSEAGPDSIADCLASLDWSTAAMLSARFAIVTPTGGLPAKAPCDDAKGAQFVDGGYVEPTSLAALADTAPELMAMLAERNAARAPGEPWLVPVLLYLRNTQGYDLAEDVARAESEPLVPITGNAARTKLTAEDAWIQRIALTLPSACPAVAENAGCRAALDGLIGADGRLWGGTVVVAPASTPAVIPPLGWALSTLSQARFTSAISTAAGCDAPSLEAAAASERASRPGHPGLATLGVVVGFDPCAAIARQSESQVGR